MTELPQVRPNFANPPLIEQAIVVAFDPIDGFDINHYGLFSEQIAPAFSSNGSTPRMENPVEHFDEMMATAPTLKINAFELPRALYGNETGETIQIQDNRFGFNWSKITEEPYPRFETTYNRFKELYRIFEEFCSKNGLKVPNIKQCELTNLNIIAVSEFGQDFSDMGNAFAIDPLTLNDQLLIPETYVRTRQHRIIDATADPIGRLHTVIQPVIKNEDHSKAFRFELTARSAPDLSGLSEAKAFFDIARSAINAAFIGTTTDAMRLKWGEKK
ncbi:TIGR04255 family protein [Parasphingorhabdus sp.]|uniref:TIGR04255 family protein n=1 Tax=Parasphingorhabdus sp. TaxID=2709688 RepID=UPI00326401D9